jgi:ribosomal protein L37AE/L43A
MRNQREITEVSNPPTCPSCGSINVYVRQRDGGITCKTCGHGKKRADNGIKHECPLCRSRRTYALRSGGYACRRCGFGQQGGINPAYSTEVTQIAHREYRKTGTAPACPVCGQRMKADVDHSLMCATCGLGTPYWPNRAYLDSLPEFKSLGVPEHIPPAATPLPPSDAPTPVRIGDLTLALNRQSDAIWLRLKLPEGQKSPFDGLTGTMIPAYPADLYPEMACDAPEVVAAAWQDILVKAKLAWDQFGTEFARAFNGITPEQALGLIGSKMMDAGKVHDTYLVQFRSDVTAVDTPSIAYAVLLYEMGWIAGDIDHELEAVLQYLAAHAQAAPEPEPVQEAPPVPELILSLDGGKTFWTYTPGHPVEHRCQCGKQDAE